MVKWKSKGTYQILSIVEEDQYGVVAAISGVIKHKLEPGSVFSKDTESI